MLRSAMTFAIGLVLTLVALPTLAQPIPSGSVQVMDVPNFSYRVEDVHFGQARNISQGAGVVQRWEMVRVIIQGVGFRPRATGPVVWLNGTPTLRTQVSEDGTSLEAYFLETVQDLDNAAAQVGRWELLIEPHEGASQLLRVSPSGDPADAGIRPAITSYWEPLVSSREGASQPAPMPPVGYPADVGGAPTIGSKGEPAVQIHGGASQAAPVPPSEQPTDAGSQLLAVLPTLNQDALEEATAHGPSKGQDFMALVKEYSFGDMREVAWGYLLTKRYRVALEALRESWRGNRPSEEIIRQILAEDLLVVKIQFFGEQASSPILLLKQGDAVIKPRITRGLYFAFPYTDLDLNAKTAIIFSVGDRQLQWEVDLARYK